MKLNTSIRKRFRVSNKVKRVASKDRFRLSISRTSKNISAQIIDDSKKITLLSASSIEKDLKSTDKVNKTELSKLVAQKLAKKAQEKKFSGLLIGDDCSRLYVMNGKSLPFQQILFESFKVCSQWAGHTDVTRS